MCIETYYCNHVHYFRLIESAYVLVLVANEASHIITVFKCSNQLWFCPFFRPKHAFVTVSGVFVIPSNTCNLITGKN